MAREFFYWLLFLQYDSVFTDENLEQTPQLGNSSVPSIDQLNITENGVCTLLKKLNHTKANGPDQIPTRILKEACNDIAPFLTNILRQSLITGEVPEDWQQANITAIYKKGDRSQAVNYRAVSLTSICCKTMEHIVYRHIIEHLENHQFFFR
jgi:hypothetical protein